MTGCGYSDTPLTVTLLAVPKGVTVSEEVCIIKSHAKSTLYLSTCKRMLWPQRKDFSEFHSSWTRLSIAASPPSRCSYEVVVAKGWSNHLGLHYEYKISSYSGFMIENSLCTTFYQKSIETLRQLVRHSVNVMTHVRTRRGLSQPSNT